MPESLTFDVLKEAVSGTAAAFRSRTTLQPAGGEGAKVFPPTYAGAVYATEKRRLPGHDQPVDCVLLDSVQSQANRMEEALQRSQKRSKGLDPRLHRAMGEGMQSQIEELRGELEEYERLRGAAIRDLELGSLDELPLLLIRARVAQGLTQKELARRLGMKEQQIQRYESTNYKSASLRRVLEIARALAIELREPARLRQTEIP